MAPLRSVPCGYSRPPRPSGHGQRPRHTVLDGTCLTCGGRHPFKRQCPVERGNEAAEDRKPPPTLRWQDEQNLAGTEQDSCLIAVIC
jgi:hypothetical protein